MNKETRDLIFKEANELVGRGNTSEAQEEFQKILAMNPDDLDVRLILGQLALRQGKKEEAINQFDWIAEFYFREGLIARSIAVYKMVTRISPEYEPAKLKLADLYTREGLITEAKEVYLEIAEECKRHNDQKKALDMYKKILEFDRDNIDLHRLLADNYYKNGFQEDAINQYLETVDLLVRKKKLHHAEELLQYAIEKTNHPKLIEKLSAVQPGEHTAEEILDQIPNEESPYNDNYEIEENEEDNEDDENLFPMIPGLSGEDSHEMEEFSMLRMSEKAYSMADRISKPIENDEEPFLLLDVEELFESESASSRDIFEKHREDSGVDLHIESILKPHHEDSVTLPKAKPRHDKKLGVELVVQDPGEKSSDSLSASGIDLDKLFKSDDSMDSNTPFKDLSSSSLGLDSSSELLKDEPLILDDSYIENENNLIEELNTLKNYKHTKPIETPDEDEKDENDSSDQDEGN